MRRRQFNPFLNPPEPGHTIDSVKPPTEYWAPPPEPVPDPNEYVRKPVTSAHAIELTSDPPQLSAVDSATLSPSGSVVHGRYGDLGADVAATVPLEYLALLHPAAQGAAAVRAVTAKAPAAAAPDRSQCRGTVLVYGATQPAGMSATQLASTSGFAVVAVVGGEHSGQDEMVDSVKGLAAEPGTAVAEEYALVKANFRDLVQATAVGDDPSTWKVDPDAFLADFKANLMDYVETYPDTLPAAVSKEHLRFIGKEKDREHFKDNMAAYLSQLPPGAAPVDPAKFDAVFTRDQYAMWRAKFHQETTAVLSGDERPDFVPPAIVNEMIASPEVPDEYIMTQKPVDDSFEFVPYEFSILHAKYSPDVAKPMVGGPVLGAVINVTPTLQVAAEAVAKAKSLRAKAEALQFLTAAERNAFAAASSVVAIATKAGGNVVVVGGKLPGLKTVEPSKEDVKEALSAMDIEEDGTSRLNYFIQVYRAGDYPVYGDYAIHRATEPLAGPRQFVVTK